MSLSGSSDSRWTSWATIRLADLLVDLPAEEHDAVVEQPRVDVERALAARGLLDDHRNEWHRGLLRSGKVQPDWLRSNVADPQPLGCALCSGVERGGRR